MNQLVAIFIACVVAFTACSGDDQQDSSSGPPTTNANPSSTTSVPLSTSAPDEVAISSWRWSVGAEAPIVPRYQHVSVWTGEELLVWGGAGGDDGRPVPRADGAAYDPVGDSWRVLAASPLSPRARAHGVWTGDELIVMGGFDDGAYQVGAAAYDPAEDSWRLLQESGLDPARRVSDLMVSDEGVFLQVASPLGWHRVDPVTGSVTAVEGDPRPHDPAHDVLAAREFRPSSMEPIWTGDEMIDAGTDHGETTRWYTIDPETGDESPLPSPPDGPTRWQFDRAWAGDRLIVWGGSYCGPNTDCSFYGPGDPVILTRDPDVVPVSRARLDEVRASGFSSR